MKTTIKILSLLVLLVTGNSLSAQSTNQNYIITRTMTDNSGVNSRDVIQYYDGLGRPLETVAKQASPTGYDLVSRPEYDNLGRQFRSWLPSPSRYYKNGSYNGETTAQGEYKDTYSCSETGYEPSPLNRPIKEYGPGQVWRDNNRNVSIEYLANISGGDQSCPNYSFSEEKITRVGTYTAGEIFVTKTIDEDNNVSYEFKDKLGRVLTQRRINDGKQVDTDFIYDDFGNLRYVLSPMAADGTTTAGRIYTEDSVVIKNYAYLYRYDKRNRCTEKKLPGAGWIYYVYDNADRLRLVQDAEQRIRKEWTYNKYDFLGRLVTTGTFTKDANPEQMKTYLNANTNFWESVSSTAVSPYKLYTNNSYPQTGDVTNMKELLANYYDNYSFLYGSSFPVSDFGYTPSVSDPEHTSAQGLLTGTRAALLDGSANYTYKVIRYDTYARPVQVKSTGTLANEVNSEYYKYNFTGQVVEKNIQLKSGTANEKYSYSYDSMGRILNVVYKINNEVQKTIAAYSYDQFGRVFTKNIAEVDKTTYSYNLRSWLTKQESPKLMDTLFYTSCPKGDIPGQFGGNIIARQWKNSENTTLRSCQYVYDQLGRMIHGVSGEGADMSLNRDQYAEHIAYDKNGNFQWIIRYGRFDNNTFGTLDVLTPQYNGNQLYKIIDSGNDQLLGDVMEHKSTWDKAYLYDQNGRMTLDPNKKIANIEYNFVNLPRRISLSTNEKMEHIYNAEGIKMQTKYIYANGTSSTVDFVGNKTFQNNKLVRVTNEEGYFEPDFGSYFYIRDYLGNNRMVIDTKGTVVQATNYYATGMSYAENPRRGDQFEQPYKFNGKLLNKTFSLDLYDYEARIYNPAINRFTTMDPLSEKYYSESPYMYCGNNPVNGVDPSGMDYYFMTDAGKVILALKTEDETDKLFAFNYDQNKVNSIDVKDKGLLSGLSGNYTSTDDGAYTYSTTSNGNDAFNVFKFGADNTKSEWSLTGYNGSGSMKYALNTNFDEMFVGRNEPGKYSSDMVFDIHSHPNKPNSEKASGYTAYFRNEATLEGPGDAGFMSNRFHTAKAAKNIWPSEYPRLYIYPKGSGKLYHFNHKTASEYVGTVSTPQSMRSLVNKHRIIP